jgi:NAD(P)-dependent dehydrogenase (short-subunit alcohol dehydrogenase family)
VVLVYLKQIVLVSIIVHQDASVHRRVGKAMSKDLAAHRIRVNTVCLDNINSAQLQRQWRASGAAQTYETWCADQSRHVPLGRLGEVCEVTDLVAFLFSERADFITGTTINIDGDMARTHKMHLLVADEPIS